MSAGMERVMPVVGLQVVDPVGHDGAVIHTTLPLSASSTTIARPWVSDAGAGSLSSAGS